MKAVLYVALGGALGSILRFGLSGWIHRITDSAFPWGTLAVNLIGCFVIGLFWAIAEHKPVFHSFSPFFVTGVLGGFTTFSAFGLDSFRLLRHAGMSSAVANLLLTNVLGLVCVLGGYVLGRMITVAEAV